MDTIPDTDVLDAMAFAAREVGRFTAPVSGMSMGPAYERVDRITVEIIPVEQLMPGMLMVYRRGCKWVVHRIVRMAPPSSGRLCVTKGDGVSALDTPPVERGEYIGVVTHVHEGTKTRALHGMAGRMAGRLAVVISLMRLALAPLLRRLLLQTG